MRADDRCDIVVAGNLPPPVHGQSLATERMIAMLRATGFAMEVHDIGPGDPRRSRLVRRLVRHAGAAVAVLRSRAPIFYLPVNNGAGMLLAVVLCLCARISAKTPILHHHSYAYVARYSAVMAALARVAGNGALHVVQSEAIGAAMRKAYRIRQVLAYSNIGIVEDAGGHAAPRAGLSGDAVTLGYLANISVEKGIYVLLNAFAALRDSGVAARLVVAGPCNDPAIVAALRTSPAVDWIGPVYARDKQAFFERIDIFAFPTMYAVETQGMVNLEAMGAGVPVVAFDRGRIGQDIGGTGGIAVPLGSDFAAALAGFVAAFDPTAASPAARERYAELLRDHERDKRGLIDWIRLRLGA